MPGRDRTRAGMGGGTPAMQPGISRPSPVRRGILGGFGDGTRERRGWLPCAPQAAVRSGSAACRPVGMRAKSPPPSSGKPAPLHRPRTSNGDGCTGGLWSASWRSCSDRVWTSDRANVASRASLYEVLKYAGKPVRPAPPATLCQSYGTLPTRRHVAWPGSSWRPGSYELMRWRRLSPV